MSRSRASHASRPPKTPLPLLSENALTILRRRYLAKSPTGTILETPSQLLWRIASDIARAERLYPVRTRLPHAAQRFYEVMARLEFLPNSPTLMNAGRPLQQLSACFVLPVGDSLESIFEAVKSQALIHQSGGGTGFSFSHLRPKDDRVASTSGVASGPVSFMRIFNMATDVIKQGGTRRGANMGVLRIDHPDILEFIAVKKNPEEMTNFNLSVGVTDEFMEAVEEDRTYALINPHDRSVVRSVPARVVFDRLVEAAWTNGEPGMLFLDTINRANPTPQLGVIESTNPCGEQPLLDFESCTLGSINVAKFVTQGPSGPEVDYSRLAEVIALAVRFLDNVIDRNRYPFASIAKATTNTRKIGLGIMGFADLLIALNLRYDAPEALTVADSLMQFVQTHAHRTSERLAGERGTFPAYRRSRLRRSGRHLRNATVTTVAPTGTISIIADCSPGIEPLYGVRVVRTVMEDVRLTSLHPIFAKRARALGLDLKKLEQEVANHESIQHLSQVPEELRRLFVTAHDVTPAQHVRMQAIFQKYSDSGVSKTINLPPTSTPADVASSFRLAHQLGCKGLTVFRSGSRDRQVLSCTQVAC
jgi:ribonucleoside-diphosphate reductase alpha chain